ncbi:MAG: MYXO-CTERM sorting domain-containing protein [Deltaproteobacteria bacterium]
MNLRTLGTTVVGICLFSPLAFGSEAARVFEENVGQADARVTHFARGARDTFFVTRDGFAIVAPGYAVTAQLGRPGPVLERSALPGRVHHLVGDPKKWRADIDTFDVVTRVAGKGVTVDHRFDERGRVAFDVHLAAGADLATFALRFDGPQKITIDDAGRLVLDERIYLTAPLASQDGEAVPCHFVIRGDAIGFEASYDPRRPLLIDPTIEYGTLLGSTGSSIEAVDADASGNIYVFGTTSQATFPTTVGVYDTTLEGTDAFVAKIDPTLTGAASLVFSTFVGGSQTDRIYAGAVGPNGRPHFFARMSNDFITTANAFDATRSGGFPGYIAVLSATGAALDYGTWFSDGGQSAIDVDAAGHIYVGGSNNSTSHPLTPSAYQSTRMNSDAYVARLDITLPPAQQLVYSTRFGGFASDATMALDADDNGHVFLLIDSGSSDLPVTVGAFQTRADTYAVARFDTNASGAASLVYSTFLGGTGGETRRVNVGDIATDGAGHAYVTGGTASADFPTTAGAFATTIPATGSAFITKIAPTGTALVYSTFVGGSSPSDEGYDIAVNSLGEAFLTHRSSLAPSPCGFAGATGLQSGLTRMNAAGSAIIHTTRLGESEAAHLALTPAGVAVIGGTLDTPTFPLSGGFATSLAGNDGFVAAVSMEPGCTDLDVDITVDPNPTTAGNGATFTVHITNLGVDPAHDVVLTDDLPDGVSLVLAEPRADCPRVDPVVCSLGTIGAGATSTVTVRISTTRSSPANILNTVEVSSSSPDANPANDVASVVLNISPRADGCGPVTYFGDCNGATLTYCEAEGTAAERVVTVDCASQFPGARATCGLVDATHGNDCVVLAGETCAFADELQRPQYALCDGSAPGCVYDEAAGEAICQEGVGPCTPAVAGAAYAPTCIQGVLAFDCRVSQPVGYDCGGAGGTCANATCSGLPEGARCNDADLLCVETAAICDVYTDRCLGLGAVCDATMFTASCDGDTLELCDPRVGRVVRTDCATAFEGSGRVRCGAPFTCLDNRSGGPCARVPPSCVGGASGDRCDPTRGIYCGPGLSCVARQPAAGEPPISTCEGLRSECAPTEITAGCEGDIATFCVGNREGTAVEPVGFDCASFGSTCVREGRTQAICEGGEGAPCDDPTLHPASLLRCLPGYACAGSGATLGTCVEVSPTRDGGVRDGAVAPDGGVVRDGGSEGPVRDAGTTRPKAPDEGGCGCTATERSDVSWGWSLALVALLFRRRRAVLAVLFALALVAADDDAEAKGFRGSTLTPSRPLGSGSGLQVGAGAVSTLSCPMTVDDCLDPIFGVSACGRIEMQLLLGVSPGLSVCFDHCNANPPDLAACQSTDYFRTICGQYEASTFLIPEPPECQPPTGPAYPCEHPSACVNLLRGWIDDTALQFGSAAPAVAPTTVVVPPTSGDNVGTPPAGSLLAVKKPDYTPVGMRSDSLETTLWGFHQTDVTQGSNLDNVAALSRIQTQRQAWAANGDVVGSCNEYAYELFYSVSQFQDQKITLGSEYRDVFDLAYQVANPVPAHALGTRGVMNLAEVRFDGAPSPDQHEFPSWQQYKNSFFAADYMNPTQRSMILADLEPGDPRPSNKQIILLDDDLYATVWDGYINGRYTESWQWHLDQSNALQPLYLDEQLFQIEKFKLEFEQLLFRRAQVLSAIQAIYRRWHEGVLESIPEFADDSFFDPSIYESQIYVGEDPISQLLAEQRAQRADRAASQGLVSSNEVVSVQHGFNYSDFTQLPSGQVTTPFSAPLPGAGSVTTRGGISATQSVARATQALRGMSMSSSLVAESVGLQGSLSDVVAPGLEGLYAMLAGVDALIEAALFEAEALGCLAPGLTPCDWSPRLFSQRVTDLGRYREPYYEQCREYTADTGFAAIVNATPFVYPNPSGGQPPELVTMVDGQSCNRAAYNTDLDAMQLYFDCVDQHKKDLVSALTQILGKEGFVIGPPPDYDVRIGGVESDTFETGNDMFEARGGFEATWGMTIAGVETSSPDWCLLEPSLHAALWAGGRALFANFELVDAHATISAEPGVDSEAYMEVAGVELVDTGPHQFATNMDFNIIEDGGEESEDFFKAQATITVVVVPVTIRGGVAGRIGATVGLGMGQPKGGSCSTADVLLEGHFTPYVGVDAFASVSIDALIVEAGIKVTLVLVQADLPLDVAVEVDGMQAGSVLGANMAVSANLDLVLSILSGWVSAFVEICYLIGCEYFEEILFRWDGPRFTQNLFSVGFEVPLLPLTTLGD